MQRRMEARWSRYPTGEVEFRALKKMKTPPTWSRTQTHSTQDERCREGKATDLEDFLCSLSQMSDLEKKQIIITWLAILMKTDTAMRRRGTGVPQVFSYYLPLL
ncbi:hypothetical protein PPTG_24826 [Phytophthora nicotianae INRA-310]|uniref:Uncharacterized protein n=1 Tax=Phytophthora nicotianae (strain INRA-310) TaxID=761204 RepID=W2PC69_PHYN3|nr:hypothetical protein PPTG_24826 [Phytophthora nicotianae INRA-310]ETM97793.1 hypothetical protein PPTG_24826 [Phytophthora nicotianae INRA-310]